MRTLLLFLTIACGTTYAQSPANSPLTPDEGRQVLGQLLELGSCREESAELARHFERDRELDTRERESWERAVELERRATGLAERERDLAREQAELYEQIYRSLTTGSGIGCRILRVITLGIHRCR
jgi:hypothetical protein